MKNLKRINPKAFIREILILTFGMFITSIAVYFFLIPSKLVIGSMSGLAIVVNALTGLPISVITLIMNVILLVLAYVLIGKEFGLKTVYTALLLSPFLYMFEKLVPMQESLMKDQWLDLLCFVIILGFAQTILFRENASSGGLDILAKIVNKYFHVELGTSVTIAGAAICCSAFLVYDLRTVIIGLIGTFINGLVLDHFIVGFNSRKRVCIFSDEHEKLRAYIIDELQRGATVHPILGGYKNEEKFEIETLMTRNEFSSLMEFVKEEKIQAFITANTVSEIYGNKGVKKATKK
ncbi:MAG: YitT family protein [Lachnospiraceae bacterium]|nr:YitT family protein [Lachnospiraceae bacterium]